MTRIDTCRPVKRRSVGLAIEYGPYSMANPTNLRFTGRQVSMRVTGEQNTDWRWGVPRVDVRPGGLR